MHAQEDLLSRIRELELELGDLWRRLVETDEELPGQPLSALEVRTGEQTHLIPVDAIREVLPMLWPVPAPDAPDWLMGTFQYAGRMVPMVDLGRRLGGCASAVLPNNHLVVCDSPAMIGLMVDAIGDVVDFDARELSPAHPGIPVSPVLLGTLVRGRDEAAHVVCISKLIGEVGEAPES